MSMFNNSGGGDKDHFKNYKDLKAAGVAVSYTPEQIKEYKKCAKDPIYFIQTYVKINSKFAGKEVLFKLFPFQKRMIQSFTDNRFTIAKIGRQFGKTEVVTAYILWYILFHEKKSCAILANLEKTAKDILARLQGSYRSLPWFLQAGVVSWNKLSIILDNGSKVITSATTESGIRGTAIDLLFIDEMSFIDSNIAESFWASSWPAISAGADTRCIVVSTPKGYNFFHKLYNEAEQNINGFVAITTHYTDVPGRDKAWADDQLKALGPVKFAQEVLVEFLGSSYTLIEGKYIGEMTPQKPLTQDQHFKIYEKPIAEHVYLLAADPAEGKNQDYSVFIVFDVTEIPVRICAVYRNNSISPNVWPNVIMNVARAYNTAFLLIETNNSPQVAQIINDEFGYENLLKRDWRSKDIGIKVDKRTKRVGCANFKDIVENGKMRINDSDLIHEIRNFVVDKRGNYAADPPHHDDCVSCLVLFSWYMTTHGYADIANENLRHNLMEKNQELLQNQMNPLGFFLPAWQDPNQVLRDLEYEQDQIDLLNSIQEQGKVLAKELRFQVPQADDMEFLKSLVNVKK